MFKLTVRQDSPYWCWTSNILGKRARGTTRQPRDEQHKEEAGREAAAAWLAECARRGAPAEAGTLELGTAILINQFAETALQARARKRNPRYAAQLETDLLKYVENRFPAVSQITPHTWQTWMDECHTRGRRPIKLRSVQRITSSANVFLRWCFDSGALQTLPVLPYPSGDEVAPETADRRALTADERDRLLIEIQRMDRRAWRIYTVLLYTGLRKSGLERLQDRWINWSTGYATFPARALKDKGKARRFYFRPNVLAAIQEEKDSWGSGVTPLTVFGPFDYDGRGEKAGLFWRAVAAAGIDDHGLTAHHVCRHTACTLAAQAGASLADLMDLGGWSSPAMAARYMHLDGQGSKRAVELL